MTTERGPTSVTADDVAELAGVSRWTVNRAFKKDASISAKARDKVLEAADRLGYAPDLLAASLASDRSNLVALLVDDFANPHKLVMMERLTRILRVHGWDTLLVNTPDENDASIGLLNASQRRVDAAILIGVKFNDRILETALGARRIKQLILFARYSESPNTISICCADQTAMEAITEHVLSRGYKKPIFLAGPQTTSAHLLRKETFLSKWKEATGVDAAFTSVQAYDPKLAYDHVTQMLTHMAPEDRPDIFVCENDALAMGAMDSIRHEFDLRVPEDIALTGFDDAPFAANPNYRLTTYRQPITAMAEGLVTFLKGDADVKSMTGYTGRLIVRTSS